MKDNPRNLPVLEPPTFYTKLQQQKKMIKQLNRPTLTPMIPATITTTLDNEVKQSNLTNINWRKDIKKWRVRLYIRGERVLLGNFETLLEATEALLIGIRYRDLINNVNHK